MESIKKLFIDLFICKTCIWAKKTKMTTCENFFLLMAMSTYVCMRINRKCKTKQNKTFEELSWSAIYLWQSVKFFYFVCVQIWLDSVALFVYIVIIKKNVGQIEFFLSPLSSRSRFLFLLLIFCCHRQCSRNRFKFFYTFSILDIKFDSISSTWLRWNERDLIINFVSNHEHVFAEQFHGQFFWSNFNLWFYYFYCLWTDL